MNKRIISLILSLSILLSAIFISGAYYVAADDTNEEPVPLYTGNFAGGGFENDDDLALWTIRNQKDQTVSIDTETTHNGSDGALVIDMPTDYYGKSTILNFRGKTVDGALADINTDGKYFTEMYIKTSEDFCGSVYLRLRQNNQYIQSNNSPDLLLLGSLEKGGKPFTNWMRIKTSAITLDNTDIQVLLYVNGTGKIWIDDINIREDKNLILNGGFDSGLSNWNNWGSQDHPDKIIEHVTDETCASAGALKLSMGGEAGGMVYMASASFIPPDLTKQYTLSMDIKCENVAVGDAFVRLYESYIDSDGNTQAHFLTCYGSDNAIATGGENTGWQHFDVKVTGFKSSSIGTNILIYINNGGTVYYDNVSLTEREKINVAAGQIAADPEPGEVAAMTSVSLVSSDDSSDIYYTLDGSDPATSSTAYLFDPTRGIYVTEDMNIKACAISEETVGEVFEFNYTCPTGIIEEDALFKEVVHPSNITLDTTNKKVGSNSIKIQGVGGKRYISTGDMPIDSAFDYKLEFWVKTEDLMEASNAFVNIFMTGSGSAQNIIDGRYGAYIDTNNIIKGIKETQDWTHYEVIIDELDEFWPTINISAGVMNDSGVLWIDGVKLTALPMNHFPLTVSSDGKVFGNNYYRDDFFGNFQLDQGFLIKNNSNNIESGVMTYTVYNDKDLNNAIGGGDFNVSVFGRGVSTNTANLTMCANFGTYTVKFHMQNERGYEYYAGSIKVAVIKDASKLNSDSIFGVNGVLSESINTLYKSTGVGMIRADLHWNQCEEEEGVLSIPDNYEKMVDSGLENGYDQLFIVGGGNVPSWYDTEGNNSFPRSDKQIAQFMNYTKMVVEHFKGRVKYYEFFNECDEITYVKVDAKTYAKVLKEFYKTVKAADSDAYVVAGATSGFDHGWAEVVIKEAGKYFDYWSLHPYTNPIAPDDKYDGNWIENMEQIQKMLTAAQGKQVPILVDEWGYSDNRGNGVSKFKSAPWYVRLMAMAESLGYIERMVIYRDIDMGADNSYVQEFRWGLYEFCTAATAYARPCVPAITNYLNMTDGYKFSEKLELAKGLYTYKYTSETKDKDVYLLWTKDVKYLANITTAETSGRLYDLFGNILSASYDGNLLSTDIDGNVLYLTLDKKDKIESVVLLDESGKDVSKEEEKPEEPKDEVVKDNNNNTDEDEEIIETIGGTETEENAPKKQLVRRKKVTKKVVKNNNNEDDGFNYIPLIIAGVAVVVAAGAGVFFIIFFKKRKNRKKA